MQPLSIGEKGIWKVCPPSLVINWSMSFLLASLPTENEEK